MTVDHDSLKLQADSQWSTKITGRDVACYVYCMRNYDGTIVRNADRISRAYDIESYPFLCAFSALGGKKRSQLLFLSRS
jgi:hypothetical protein